MVPFSSSCCLRNAIHSVVEAVYDPVLHHSLTSDFDTYVYVYTHTHTCESYYGEATLSQTSWLVSWLSQFSQSMITAPELSLQPCPNSHTYSQTASSPLHSIPYHWFYQSLTKSLKINYLIQLYREKKCVWMCTGLGALVLIMWVWHYFFHTVILGINSWGLINKRVIRIHTNSVPKLFWFIKLEAHKAAGNVLFKTVSPPGNVCTWSFLMFCPLFTHIQP